MRYVISFIFLNIPFCVHAQVFSLSENGYGPVKIGMTRYEASKALGTTLIPDRRPNKDCYQAHARHGHAGISFMFENYHITRASLYGYPTEIKSNSNIKIGDTEKLLKQVYGDQITAIHPLGYDYNSYVIWYSKIPLRGIRYEVEFGKVTMIHGGSASIEYCEGCE
jgi:hypothetical protein